MAAEVTFQGYKISANSKLLGGDTWTGSYIIEKDGQLIRVRHSITWRNTAKLAEASALVFGIQFVDNCMVARLAAKQTAAMVEVKSRAAAGANPGPWSTYLHRNGLTLCSAEASAPPAHYLRRPGGASSAGAIEKISTGIKLAAATGRNTIDKKNRSTAAAKNQKLVWPQS